MYQRITLAQSEPHRPKRGPYNVTVQWQGAEDGLPYCVWRRTVARKQQLPQIEAEAEAVAVALNKYVYPDGVRRWQDVTRIAYEEATSC